MWLVLTVLALASGLGLLGYGLWSARLADASQSWEVTKGELLACDIIEVRGRYGARAYRLRARYAYEVEGTRRVGTRVCFGEHFWESHAELGLWLDENAPGRRIDVFYDPRRPGRAVLLPGRAGAQGFVMMAIAGLLVTAVSVVAVYRAIG